MNDELQGGVTATEESELLGYQKAIILLQFLRNEEKRLTRSDLGAKLRTKTIKEATALDPEAINQVLTHLVGQGYLSVKKHGKGSTHTLTQNGEDYLGASDQYPTIEIRLTGTILNVLMALARKNGATTRPVVTESHSLPGPEELDAAILRAFEGLRRERYSHLDMVPIFEVRRRVGERLGPHATRQDVFDPCVRDLRRSGRLRTIAISDLSDATDEQLAESVPGVNETLFYLEATDHEFSRLG